MFLSKRNFRVFAVSDIKEALTQLIEQQPDFIFLAWDHTNPVVTSLPKLISQASGAIIVPYIMSNTKEAARKFNICPLNPKLYPPISGPAIERLVLKFEKQSTEDIFKLAVVKTKMSTQEDINTIKSNFMANLDNIISEAEVEAVESEKTDGARLEAQQQQVDANEKTQRKDSIEKRSGLLRQSLKANLTTENIDMLKKSFDDKVKQPLENLINTLNESQGFGEISVVENADESVGGVKVTETSYSAAGNGSVMIQQGASLNLGSLMQKGAGRGQDLGSITQEATSGPIKNGTITESSIKAYCMSVYSENWCGYLIITTAVQLDFSSVDMIFTDWIKQQFQNMQDIDEYDFFEFRDVDPSILKSLTEKADYVETLEINGFNLNVGFFPIEPDKMNIDLNDDKSLIKILTEDIPADSELGFSLHLHLPENKKYLLYTQANKTLSYEQKKRLVSNKIFQLYTPLDFTREYKKFMIEKNVRELYQNLSKKFSV